MINPLRGAVGQIPFCRARDREWDLRPFPTALPPMEFLLGSPVSRGLARAAAPVDPRVPPAPVPPLTLGPAKPRVSRGRRSVPGTPGCGASPWDGARGWEQLSPPDPRRGAPAHVGTPALGHAVPGMRRVRWGSAGVTWRHRCRGWRVPGDARGCLCPGTPTAVPPGVWGGRGTPARRGTRRLGWGGWGGCGTAPAGHTPWGTDRGCHAVPREGGSPHRRCPGVSRQGTVPRVLLSPPRTPPPGLGGTVPPVPLLPVPPSPQPPPRGDHWGWPRWGRDRFWGGRVGGGGVSSAAPAETWGGFAGRGGAVRYRGGGGGGGDPT